MLNFSVDRDAIREYIEGYGWRLRVHWDDGPCEVLVADMWNIITGEQARQLANTEDEAWLRAFYTIRDHNKKA